MENQNTTDNKKVNVVDEQVKTKKEIEAEKEAAMAQKEIDLDEKLRKADGILARMEALEKSQLDASTKKDNTRPIPLTYDKMVEYMENLRIHKPKIYEKKLPELQIKLAELKKNKR